MGTDVTVLVLDGPPDAGVARRRRDRATRGEVEPVPTDERAVRAERRRGCSGASSPPETFALVDRAVRAWSDTGGRYDPTVLPAVVAAGYDRDFDAVAAEGAGPARDVGARPRLRRHRARRAVCAPSRCPPASRSTSEASARATPPTSSPVSSSTPAPAARSSTSAATSARSVQPPSRTAGSSRSTTPSTPARTGMLALARRCDRHEHPAAPNVAARRHCAAPSHRSADRTPGDERARVGHGRDRRGLAGRGARQGRVHRRARSRAGQLITESGATGLLVHDDGRVVDLEGLAAVPGLSTLEATPKGV